MTTISAKVVADSVHSGHRLTTLELEYPRSIHAQLLTHRVFSRNSQSSRAIPVSKMIEKIDPSDGGQMVTPLKWQLNQPGMRAGSLMPVEREMVARQIWFGIGGAAISAARSLEVLGAPKQTINRLLEPFSTITTLVSSTTWDNFFLLRIHKDTQPEMVALARAMKKAIDTSEPEQLTKNQWHTPYVEYDNSWLPHHPLDMGLVPRELLVSAARCARVSYLNHGGGQEEEKDVALALRLAENWHFSPLEHVAIPGERAKPSNFQGWTQFRKLTENG